MSKNKFYYTYMIYITNPKSSLYGKVYYGQHTTDNLDDRYICSSTIIKKWVKKHPKDYYRKILRLYNSKEELNQAEYELIKPHLGKEYCLNLCSGGIAPRKDLNHTDETKEKCRIGSLGNRNASGKRTEEQVRHIAEGWEKSDKESRIKKQKTSIKKFYEDPKHREEAGERIKNLWKDPTYRAKTCAAHTRIITEEELEKRSKSMQGKNKGKHKVWDNKELNIYHMER